MKSQPIEVMLCGRQALLRETLAARLAAVDGIVIRGHWGTPAEVLDAATAEPPSLLLIDLDVPDEPLWDLVAAIRRRSARTRILVLGLPDVEEAALKCIEAGAAAYLSKDASVDELLGSIRRVRRGEAVCSTHIADSLFSRLAELAHLRRRRDRVEALKLTPREMEILQLIADGLSNRAIAERLALSVYTVKNHVHHILEKLEVRDRGGAVRHAYRRHWIRDRRQIQAAS